MATRFYLESSGSTPVSPAFGGGGSWEVTSSAIRVPMDTTKAGTALTSKLVTISGSASLDTSLFYQFVSVQQLAAQTIPVTDIITGVMKADDQSSTAGIEYRTSLYIVSSDGSTVRGTLKALATETGDWPSPIATWRVYAASDPIDTQVTSQDGDYLVWEVGGFNNDSVSQDGTLRVGSSAASDFAHSDNLTTDLNPWMELSTNITWWTPSSHQLMTLGCGT